MNIFNRTLIAACSLALAAASQAAPGSFVWVGPTTYNVNVGDTVVLDLWAFATPNTITQVDGFEAAMQWTSPTVVHPSAYAPVFTPASTPNHFNQNNTFGTGGIAAYDINTNVQLTSSGTELGQLTFHADALGSSTISLVSDTMDNPTNPAWFAVSQVYTTQAGLNGGFQPDFGPNVTINVGPVPEPASIACLGLGAVALIRKRRARKMNSA